jgi:hypothetical protein
VVVNKTRGPHGSLNRRRCFLRPAKPRPIAAKYLLSCHPVELLGKQLPLWAMLGDGDSRLVPKYHSLNDFRDMWPYA